MMVGLELERISGRHLATGGDDRFTPLVDDYAAPNISEKIVRIIHSYTDYVNRVVWKKYS